MPIQAVAKRVERKAYVHILVPLFIASILAFLDRVNVSYAELKMSVDLAFDSKIYGFGAGIFFLGYVLFEVPGSIWAEKWSPSKWIARIMFTWGGVCMLMAFMTLPWHFYILRFLLGACEASLYPVIYACVIPRWFTADTRARAISITLTSLLLSAIIGAPVAGTLISFEPFGFHGWQSLFFIEGGVTVLFGFYILKFLRDDPAEAKWLDGEEKNYLIKALADEKAVKTEKADYSIWQALTNPRVLRLSVTYFLWIVGFWGFNFWMPQIIQAASGGWSPLKIGFVAIIPMAVALVAMVLIGNSASKRKEAKYHVGLTLLLGFIGYLMLALTWGQSVTLSLIALVILAVGVYASMGVWWSIPTTFLSGAAAAGATGLINSVGNIGGFIGPYMIGYIRHETGNLTISFYILGFSVLASAILVLTLKMKK